MLDKPTSILLTTFIAPGYLPGFLTDPLVTADVALNASAVPGQKLAVIYGTDFKGLLGQITVPYGLVLTLSDGEVYVAIRGTDSIEEWLEDGFAAPEPWPFAGHTHKGFTDVYQTLTVGAQRLADYLRGLPAAVTGRKPTITGHSLGAALANLLAADMGPDCDQCVTFEGPRVGALDFCNWMDGRVPNFYRYVIIGDVVPHAPPELLGYQHAGTEIEMDPSGVIPLTLDPKEYLESHHVLTSVQALLEAPST